MNTRVCEVRGYIEKLDREEVETFFPVKRYAAHFPPGYGDGHGATVKYCATKREAQQALRHPRKLP